MSAVRLGDRQRKLVTMIAKPWPLAGGHSEPVWEIESVQWLDKEDRVLARRSVEEVFDKHNVILRTLILEDLFEEGKT